MCVVIYSYIHERETDKNTKFHVVQLNTNQTHIEVLCSVKKMLLTKLITIIRM
jgi:hypothetical protein